MSIRPTILLVGCGVVLACSSAPPPSAAPVPAPPAPSAPAPTPAPEPVVEAGPACAAPKARFEPGCDVEGSNYAPFEAGCYQACEGEGDGSCPEATRCTRTSVNPCPCPPEAEACCDACGAERWLCLEASEPQDPGTPLAADQIKQGMRQGNEAAKACFAKELMDDRGAAGRVTVRLVIEPTGAVSSAEVKESDFGETMDGCILDVVRGLTFPEHTARPMGVVYPFDFN